MNADGRPNSTLRQFRQKDSPVELVAKMEVPHDVNGNEGRKSPMAKPDQVAVVATSPSVEPSLLGQWSTVTGWHGISDAYLARGLYWKVMWVLVVLGTMTVGLNQCISMIIDFVTDDKWTSSITSRSTESLPVPTLYVCSLNVYNQSVSVGRHLPDRFRNVLPFQSFAENGITADKVVENAGSSNIPPSVLQNYQAPFGSFRIRVAELS